MEVTFSMTAPRDEASVSMVRWLCRDVLRCVGVDEECVEDVALAVTEACTNVVKHRSSGGDEYDVTATISGARCEISIGNGAVPRAPASRLPDPFEETGRGRFLIEVLVDDVRFDGSGDVASTMSLVKNLTFRDNSLLLRVLERADLR